MNIGHSICYVWNMLARRHCIGAVLAILFVHYRSVFLTFAHTAVNDGFMQTFFNLILNFADSIRGYYHISHEIIRSLGQNQIFSFANENFGEHYARRPSRQRDSVHSQNNENVPTRNNKINSSAGPLPQLVEVRNSVVHGEGEVVAPRNGSFPTVETAGSIPSNIENEMAPLEPAFLNKEDYPTGWLVYHPVLGLTSVKEADQHNDQQSLERHKNE